MTKIQPTIFLSIQIKRTENIASWRREIPTFIKEQSARIHRLVRHLLRLSLQLGSSLEGRREREREEQTLPNRGVAKDGLKSLPLSVKFNAIEAVRLHSQGGMSLRGYPDGQFLTQGDSEKLSEICLVIVSNIFK